MTVVTHELDKIHNSYNNRLKYKKFIPCNCTTCKNSQTPHFYEYENELRRYIEHRRPTIECRSSFEMVNVQGLIDDVIDIKQLSTKKEREETSTTNIINYGTYNHNETHQGDINAMEETRKPKIRVKSAWANGSFYLFLFLVVVFSIGFLAGSLPVYDLVLVIIGGVLFIPLIGAFQLRQDERLKEEHFLQLIKMVIGQLPLVGNVLGKRN
jgi:hypothetical protein